jgi:hypothetical protein
MLSCIASYTKANLDTLPQIIAGAPTLYISVPIWN